MFYGNQNLAEANEDTEFDLKSSLFFPVISAIPTNPLKERENLPVYELPENYADVLALIDLNSKRDEANIESLLFAD